jgi:hypothetical protein
MSKNINTNRESNIKNFNKNNYNKNHLSKKKLSINNKFHNECNNFLKKLKTIKKNTQLEHNTYRKIESIIAEYNNEIIDEKKIITIESIIQESKDNISNIGEVLYKINHFLIRCQGRTNESILFDLHNIKNKQCANICRCCKKEIVQYMIEELIGATKGYNIIKTIESINENKELHKINNESINKNIESNAINELINKNTESNEINELIEISSKITMDDVKEDIKIENSYLFLLEKEFFNIFEQNEKNKDPKYFNSKVNEIKNELSDLELL